MKWIIPLFIFFSSYFYSAYQPFSYLTYHPEDINLRDAAYHKSYGRIEREWWYFEGIFENGYSIVFGIIISSKGSYGQCIIGLHIYLETNLKYCLSKKVSMKEVQASEEFPFIVVSQKEIMKLDRDYYNSTGKWLYTISVEIDNKEARLLFEGTTKGYKGRVLDGWYGPVLPKAIVNGTLTLDGKSIEVNGLGYHEHGWGISSLAWGWYWGKIVSDSFSLTWARMMHTPWREQIAAVLSIDKNGYININPENVKIKVCEYTFKRRIIPTEFIINISDYEKGIFVNATLKVINIHHISRVIHYWKYHIKVNGQITYHFTEKIVDQIQIMEIVRF
jgi:hypothetical protein